MRIILKLAILFSVPIAVGYYLQWSRTEVFFVTILALLVAIYDEACTISSTTDSLCKHSSPTQTTKNLQNRSTTDDSVNKE